MSASGQKPTCAPQNVMSALHPIATAKADSHEKYVRFASESGRAQCKNPMSAVANSRLMQRSKKDRYSINGE
jgi:hypothetical protein